MTTERLSFDELLSEGISQLLHPAPVRRRAAQRLPQLVADRLARPVEAEARAAWVHRFTEEFWPALQRARGSKWELGWAELVAGFAVAVELLAGALPASIWSRLEGTPAQPHWEQWRHPYARYALLLESEVHICRVFAARSQRTRGVLVENEVPWRHEGRRFLGRSHTLLLALLADGLLPESMSPLAATGELAADGCTVSPVLGLVTKVKAWRKAFPEGVIVTGPPGTLDKEAWKELAGRKSYGSVDSGVTNCWLVGGSMAELAAKLQGTAPPITRWDGAPLDAQGIAEARLEVPAQETRPEAPFGDPLLDAAWAASQQSGESRVKRGVLIEGAAGAGKSIFSRVLEHRFHSGVLGALGFGVRRAARELAEDLRQTSTKTWSAVLAQQEPEQRPLFEELERTGRLVPLVDGLDELRGTQLREVAALLRSSPGWWLATSRPVAAIVEVLPPAWNLRILEPSHEQGRKLLIGAGRPDLAESLYGDVSYRSKSLPASLAALTETPLHLALLAKVTREGERLEQLAAHELYRRVFQGLLDQACQDQRLTERAANQLRELQVSAIGQLALAWLQAPHGFLERATVDLILEEAGFKASERSDLVQALEFGHLLAPAADAWEFAHRTLAEWAASEALHREVLGRQRKHARNSRKPDDRVQRAQIELEVLAPFLERKLLVDSSAWVQLLRFYAPHISEPLALLERLTGPAARAGWHRPDGLPSLERDELEDAPPTRPATASEVLHTWVFIFELLAQASWRRPEEACAVWGIAVRRWLLFEHSDERTFRYEQDFPQLKAFARGVASHLPRSLSALCTLAGKTPEQLERLRAEPTLLLPAIPPAQVSVLDPLLRGPPRAAQVAVLKWYAEHDLEVKAEVIDTLIQTLATEVVSVEAKARIEWAQHGHEGPQVALPAVAHSDMLHNLEVLVWEAGLRTRRGLLWPLVRSRLLSWPRHLDKTIVQWFGARPAEEDSSTSAIEDQRRLEVLAACLAEASAASGELIRMLNRLRTEPGGPEAVGHLWSWFDEGEELQLRRMMGELAAKVGWEVPKYGTGSAASKELEAGLKQLHGLTKRLEALLRALHEARLATVLGALWELLPPDAPEREVLLDAIDAAARLPPQITASWWLTHHAKDTWRLERTSWTPKHLAELKELAAAGQGMFRFWAIRLLAQREKRDETFALLQALPSADDALAALIREHLERSGGLERAAPAVSLPAEALSQLPLKDRAERNVPGWRDELLARLSRQDDREDSLAEIAMRHGVHQALPLLSKRLERSEWKPPQLIEAIARLCTREDTQWARVALREALIHGWPDGRAERYRSHREPDQRFLAGEALAGFLTLEDLDLLAQSKVSALAHPSLAGAIRRLGPEATERLLARHREAAQEVAREEREAQARKNSRPLLLKDRDWSRPSSKERRDALAETLVAAFDPAHQKLIDLVELAFHLVGGDVHHLYGIPGPLGSDFDEPGDLDWHSSQENQELITALGHQLEACLSHEPDAWPELRRLFQHPSESMRQRAFDLCADRATPHQVAEFALEALEGHVRSNKTQWSGNTAGYLLSGGPGAGTSYVELPRTLSHLAKAVRKRLTRAHRRVIETLAHHKLAMFRGLAAQWAGELGDESWGVILYPLLRAPEAEVVRSALDALLMIAPGRLDEELRQADRSAWTSRHDTAVLDRLRMRAPKSRLAIMDPQEAVDPLQHVQAATVELLLSEAASRSGPASQEPRPAPTPFDGFPSPVEGLCHALWKEKGPSPECEEMLRRWSQHERAEVRAVSRRLRASYRLLTPEEVLPLLSGEALEQISAAECLVRMAYEPHREEASAVWLAALGSWEHRGRLGTVHLDRYLLEDRLMWALRGATPAFAPLLGLMVRTIDFDSAEMSDTSEGERRVKQTLQVIRRWGEPGMAVLLELMEAGEVEEHYSFLEAVKATARRSESFYELLRKRAADGEGPAQRAFEDLSLEQERKDLDGLVARLSEEVFPEGWPAPLLAPVG